MGTRRRLSSESSSYSYSSGLSYYRFGGGGGSSVSDEEISSAHQCATSHKSSNISRTFFDDVKVILSRHDTKLSKLEDDLSCVVRWLNEKFDFCLKYESTSSIPSFLEDHANDNNPINSEGDGDDDDDGMIDEGDQDQDEDVDYTASSIPPSIPGTEMTAHENLNDDDENEIFSESSMHKSQAENEDLPSQVNLNNYGRGSNRGNDLISNHTITATKHAAYVTIPSAPVKNDKLPNKLPASIKRTRTKRNPNEPQRPTQCDTCGKFLKDQSTLRQHKKIHLNIRPFVCTEPNCEKSFRRKFHLQTHALIHKGVKNHQCGYCGRCFLLQKDLITHERIHTGERPFNCSACTKSFTLKSHLVMHLRTHTGERPYKCDVCHKTFSQSNSLRLHKKKLHQHQHDSNVDPSTSQQKSRKKKATKIKDKKMSAVANLQVTPPPTPPAKLPIYRNQSTILQTVPSTSCRVVPSSAITVFHQPFLPNVGNQQPQTIEIFQPIQSIDNSTNKIVLTESSLSNIFSSALPVVQQNTTVPFITSEILNVPQQVLQISRNNQ